MSNKYKTPTHISVFYFSLALIWLGISDVLLAQLNIFFGFSITELTLWHIAKGALFMLFSAALIWYLIYYYNQKQDEHIGVIMGLNKKLKTSMSTIEQKNTKLKKQYKQLYNQYRLYNAIAENLPDIGVVIISNEHKGITFADGKAVKAIGGKDFLIKKDIKSITSSETAETLTNQYQKVITGESVDFTVQIKSKFYQISATLMPNKEDVLVCFKEVTDRMRQEAKVRDVLRRLKDKNKRLRNYSFTISHELRRPLANILGISSLMKEEKDPELLNDLEVSAKELDEIFHKVSEFLD